MGTIEALRLNKKDNKDKAKTVEEKEESGMETALNAFKEVVEKEEAEVEVEEEEELEQTQPKHPTLLNPNHNHYQSLLNTIQLTHHHLNKQNQTR
jgi:hypothetical protein